MSNKYDIFISNSREERVEDEETQRILNIPDKEIWTFYDETTSKWGFEVKSTGEIIISPKYDDVWEFSEGLAPVELNGFLGFIDKTGKEITPLKYEEVFAFSEGLAPVELNGKWGFIDKTGKEVIPCKYDFAWDFSQGKAEVELKGKTFYIDKTGKRIG